MPAVSNKVYLSSHGMVSILHELFKYFLTTRIARHYPLQSFSKLLFLTKRNSMRVLLNGLLHESIREVSRRIRTFCEYNINNINIKSNIYNIIYIIITGQFLLNSNITCNKQFIFSSLNLAA